MRKQQINKVIQTSAHKDQQGFITLIIFLTIVLVAVLAMVYLRVLKAQK